MRFFTKFTTLTLILVLATLNLGASNITVDEHPVNEGSSILCENNGIHLEGSFSIGFEEDR